MSGNSFGNLFVVTTFGESHGNALGVVVDGCPPSIPFGTDDLRRELLRRKGGGHPTSTARAEEDCPEILSGVFQGKTLGTPIAIIVRNTDAVSADYENLKDTYRPGHADWTWDAKYGFRDYRGGGRASGRETVSRVMAGAVAKAFLSTVGVSFYSKVESQSNTDADLISSGDTGGSLAYFRIEGAPVGLGEPVFDKLDALLAAAVLSIGGVKGIEFGAGFKSASMRGSTHNDAILPPASIGERLPNGVTNARFASNNAGGVLGGISNGAPIEFRAVFKPVPSIGLPQMTIDKDGNPRQVTVEGRHDVVLAPRALVVVEAMCACVLADLLLRSIDG